MWVLLIALAFGATESTPTDHASSPQARRFDPDARQAKLLTRLMARGDEAAVEYVLERVAGGLPPQSLDAFVDGARMHPQAAYEPALRKLSRYRKDSIRARALVALGAIDPTLGAEAALLAMNDTSVQIRLLGLDLGTTYTAPHVEEAMLRLLARDEAVAKAALASRN